MYFIALFYPSAWADQRGPLGVKEIILSVIKITPSGLVSDN